MKAYSQSAGYADQALQAIKIVHTYGQEKLEEKNYKKYLSRCNDLSTKTNIYNAIGMSLIMVCFTGFYAYSFYFGGLLRWRGIKNFDGKEYSGGVIVTIMFSTVFAATTLGVMAPHFKALSEG
jgi:ABC-type multidrug transport system fused ATPase/permease subunit